MNNMKNLIERYKRQVSHMENSIEELKERMMKSDGSSIAQIASEIASVQASQKLLMNVIADLEFEIENN